MKISNCICGSDRVERGKFFDIYYIRCLSCKKSTRDHSSIDNAIKEWENKNAKTKNK